MKKLLGIVVLGLLWGNVGVAYDAKIEKLVPIGSTKEQVCKIIDENKKTDERYLCHGMWKKFYKYFPNFKTEILYNGQDAEWFVFENVNKRMKCGFIYCRKKGDGTLRNIAYSQQEALIYSNPNLSKEYKEERRKVEEKRIAEEEKNQAEEKKKEEEKKEEEKKKQIKVTSMIDDAKDKCKVIGFTEGTDKFVDCSLKLYSQSVELAAKQNQRVVIQGQSSGSNVMTIYDPVRDNNALIKRGQGLINGTCTLANLSNC